jgi:methylated-DNA-protein-cysteine methyltransferase related protein
MSAKDELFELVRRIPAGRCAAYGALGRALPHPVSGYLVGRWMASAPEGVPWWRVVSKDGTLVIARRDPALGQRQRRLLESEGIPFEGENVVMKASEWKPEEIEP